MACLSLVRLAQVQGPLLTRTVNCTLLDSWPGVKIVLPLWHSLISPAPLLDAG